MTLRSRCINALVNVALASHISLMRSQIRSIFVISVSSSLTWRRSLQEVPRGKLKAFLVRSSCHALRNASSEEQHIIHWFLLIFVWSWLIVVGTGHVRLLGSTTNKQCSSADHYRSLIFFSLKRNYKGKKKFLLCIHSLVQRVKTFFYHSVCPSVPHNEEKDLTSLQVLLISTLLERLSRSPLQYDDQWAVPRTSKQQHLLSNCYRSIQSIFTGLGRWR